MIMSADDIDVPESLTDPTKFPSGPGWDLYFGYGRNNARASVDMVMSGNIPPEADIVAPDWFEPIDADARPSVAITGRVGARADGLPARYENYHYVLEYALGVDPKSGWTTLVEDNTAGIDGTIHELDTAEIASSIDYGAPLTAPHQYSVTLRLRVEADNGGTLVKSESRKTIHIIRDPDLLSGFPLQFPASLEGSPKAADLDGDGTEEIILPTSDGWVHALKADGTELTGWPVRLGLRPSLDPEKADNTRGACAYLEDPKPARCGTLQGRIDPDVGQSTIATPAVGDLDGDESLEVVITTWDGQLFVFEADGSTRAGFPVSVDPSFTEPTFAPGEEPDEDEVLLDGAFQAVPVLANLTEFGSTPFYTTDELRGAGVDIALYCCGAYRAMNKAALHFYETVRRDGTQKHIIDTLQTRAELYDFLGYHAYEDKLDALFADDKKDA